LRQQLLAAGWTPVRLFYFNAFGVLPWFVNNRILRKGLADRAVDGQIKVFDRLIVPAVRMLENLVPPPCGQSLMAVARAAGDARVGFSALSRERRSAIRQS
jgi:hypothetical protein